MSKKDKQVVVYALTHAVDWLINHDGKKHSLPQWQVEVMKVVATLLITAAV